MKKRTSLFLVLVLVAVCCGCQKKTGTIVCTASQTPTTGVSLKSEYIITYKDSNVTKLKTTEKITTSNTADLKTYQDSLNAVYDLYKDIEYYSNNISIEDKTLISSTVINYEKVDTNKLIEVDKNNANLIKDGKVKAQDVKKMYESNGCNCKQK